MIIERKPIAINGTDFTSYFTDTGYSVEYTKRLGNRGGMMQDGSMTEDLITVKAIVTLPCMPLNETQLQNLLMAILSMQYPLLEYFDPLEKGLREVLTIAEGPSMSYKGFGTDANSYWGGMVVALTEK